MRTILLAAAVFAAFTTFARSAPASEIYAGYCEGWGEDVDLCVDTGDGNYTYCITFSSPYESWNWPAEKKWIICASHVPEICALLESFEFDVGGIRFTVASGSGSYTGIVRCRNRLIAPADLRLD